MKRMKLRQGSEPCLSCFVWSRHSLLLMGSPVVPSSVHARPGSMFWRKMLAIFFAAIKDSYGRLMVFYGVGMWLSVQTWEKIGAYVTWKDSNWGYSAHSAPLSPGKCRRMAGSTQCVLGSPAGDRWHRFHTLLRFSQPCFREGGEVANLTASNWLVVSNLVSDIFIYLKH